MKTRGQIVFDFNNAQSQARRLDDLASELERRVVHGLADSVQELSSAWKGSSASAYLQKEERLQNNISKTASNLRDIASEIRIVAKRVYDAEMYAIYIAQN